MTPKEVQEFACSVGDHVATKLERRIGELIAVHRADCREAGVGKDLAVVQQTIADWRSQAIGGVRVGRAFLAVIVLASNLLSSAVTWLLTVGAR